MKIVYLSSPGVASDVYHTLDTLHKIELDSCAISSPNVASTRQDQFVVSHGPIAISKPPPPQVLIAECWILNKRTLCCYLLKNQRPSMYEAS